MDRTRRGGGVGDGTNLGLGDAHGERRGRATSSVGLTVSHSLEAPSGILPRMANFFRGPKRRRSGRERNRLIFIFVAVGKQFTMKKKQVWPDYRPCAPIFGVGFTVWLPFAKFPMSTSQRDAETSASRRDERRRRHHRPQALSVPRRNVHVERRRPPLLPDTPPAHVHRRRHPALDVRDRLGQPRGQGLPGHGVGLPRHRAGVQQLPRRVLPQSALEHVPGHRGSRDAVQRGGARRGGPPGDVGAPPPPGRASGPCKCCAPRPSPSTGPQPMDP